LPVGRPEWWEWELGFDSHIEDRMEERELSEVELRTMLADATGVAPARRQGRWIVETHFRGQRWVVVLEPDAADHITYVITVFRRD
jgi:hypothetical protein